jgi:hypothetical protein
MDDPPPFQHTRVLTRIPQQTSSTPIMDWNIEHRLGRDQRAYPPLSRVDTMKPLKNKCRSCTTHTGSEWVVFEDGTHMAHAEETKSHLEVVDDF